MLKVFSAEQAFVSDMNSAVEFMANLNESIDLISIHRLIKRHIISKSYDSGIFELMIQEFGDCIIIFQFKVSIIQNF